MYKSTLPRCLRFDASHLLAINAFNLPLFSLRHCLLCIPQSNPHSISGQITSPYPPEAFPCYSTFAVIKCKKPRPDEPASAKESTPKSACSAWRKYSYHPLRTEALFFSGSPDFSAGQCPIRNILEIINTTSAKNRILIQQFISFPAAKDKIHRLPSGPTILPKHKVQTTGQ